MMNYGDKRDSNLNIFIFISLIIHAVIFWFGPEWDSLKNFGVEGTAQGGVIRVIYSQPSPARELSPITDPTSQTTAPQVERPRPTEEPSKEHPAATPVVPGSRDNITPPARTRPEAVEVKPPTPPVVTETLPEREPEEVATELITSESGKELYVEQLETESEIEPEQVIEQESEPEVEVEQNLDIEQESETTEEQSVDESGVSGTGTNEMGDITDGSGSVQESGFGEAEIAPPPPPPPAGGSVLNISGNGGVPYPKNAENEKVEGVVQLEVLISSNGSALAADISQSSGDLRLDRQAQWTFLNNWEFLGAEFDYILVIDVSFSITEGINVTPVAIRWAEE